MFQDIIEIENLFDEPKEIIAFANKCKYYDLNDHPTDKNGAYWVGKRTKNLEDLDLQFKNKIFNELFKKIFSKFIIDDPIYWYYHAKSYFHKIDNSYKWNDSWIHTDIGHLFSGIVYLDDSTQHLGTGFYDDDNNLIHTMNYKFNSGTIFNSKIKHAALGTEANQDRLCLVFFIQTLSISKNLKLKVMSYHK